MKQNKIFKSSFTTTLLWIFTGFILACFIKFFIIDFVKTSGESMNPTLKNDEILCINKMAYGLINPGYDKFIVQWKKPARGDIVIFLHDDKIVVKRCILTEGDSLEILSDKHYSFKYQLKSEDTIIPVSYEQSQWLKQYSKVPEGYVFVAGDNFNNSIDSRDYGFVSTKNITGKVVGKYK